MEAVFYIHGQGGSAQEAAHYRPLFPGCAVIGLEWHAAALQAAVQEVRDAVAAQAPAYDRRRLIANSIGAWFAMQAGIEDLISHACFISPVVDMEALIAGMMARAGVTAQALERSGRIRTAGGEVLSWEDLCYVRTHPLRWRVPTEILCGSADQLTPPAAAAAFARRHPAHLTVMEGGEHWFHTEAQMQFLDRWIREITDC